MDTTLKMQAPRSRPRAKWLKVTRQPPWRRPIANLNILLASHDWRQDHNGLTHQDPGFNDRVVNKKAETIRVYLPPDSNTLLSVMDHCLRGRHHVNVIVASKHPSPQWLTPRLSLFTRDKTIVFAYHGFPWLIHRLTYRRTNHKNLHLRGYKEEGTISTAFDMTVMNELDRFHLVADVVDRLPQLGGRVAYARKAVRDKLIEHKQDIREHGQDKPEIRDRKWTLPAGD